MPNDSLITALEQLRETYSQRQRATNSLMGALRGTTSALGKSSRALREYLEQSPNADGGVLAQAQEVLAPGPASLGLKDEVVDPLVPELRREVKVVGTLVTALKDSIAALRGDAVDVVRLGHAYQILQSDGLRSKVQDPALDELLPRVDEELQRAQRELGVTFGQTLRDALAELGIEIAGRPPRFEIGRFALTSDFVNRRAALSYGNDLISNRIPLSVEAVVKAYQGATKGIMGRNEDAGRWIELFYQAWQTAIRKRDRKTESANIVDCYFELTMLRQSRAFRIAPSKSTFADYTRAQFAYDFFEFTDRQRQDYKGQYVRSSNATKSHAENPERSFWIVEGDGPFDGRYIGDVTFEASR